MGLSRLWTCSNCGITLRLSEKGRCLVCRRRDREIDAAARPEQLRLHPDLATLDVTLNGWYG